MSLWERILSGFKTCVVKKDSATITYSVFEFPDSLDGAPRKIITMDVVDTYDGKHYHHSETYDNGLLTIAGAILRCSKASVTIDDRDRYTIDICRGD